MPGTDLLPSGAPRCWVMPWGPSWWSEGPRVSRQGRWDSRQEVTCGHECVAGGQVDDNGNRPGAPITLGLRTGVCPSVWPAPPPRSCRQGPGHCHTHTRRAGEEPPTELQTPPSGVVGGRLPAWAEQMLRARTPHRTQVCGVIWTPSPGPLLAFGGHPCASSPCWPSGTGSPLTMMASACLASSSETALRKPLAWGEAELGVGMAPVSVQGSPPRPSAGRPLIG